MVTTFPSPNWPAAANPQGLSLGEQHSLMRAAAFEYMELGFHVYPIRGKRPITPHGRLDATNSPSAWDDLVGPYRHVRYGLAVSHRPSGIECLDLDHRGDDAARTGQCFCDGLPPSTPAVETAGGMHFYFSADKPRPSARSLKPGVEYLGGASGSALPPSTHPCGRMYRWVRGPGGLGPLPDQVRMLLENHITQRRVAHPDIPHTTNTAGVRRWTRSDPCPVCGGCPSDPRGKGLRCWGFSSSDGAMHCTRETYAGRLQRGSHGAYVHRLSRYCPCGLTHVRAA
jgi:hypothetical protein